MASTSSTTTSPALSFAVPAQIPATDDDKSIDDITDAERAERDEYRRRILARAELVKVLFLFYLFLSSPRVCGCL